ncbi:gliding motility protein GldL [Cardinium endosymbiont of Philonthus spinipes]|uniref:type IX secretion system motor protein PorL/GldL n=1 Tax=Cardinium endosymbiont of Philonthus spinipes TaxID=3077941 RepID=UPI00313EE8FC
MKHNLISNSFTHKFYNTIMPLIYNIGAAIVIFGAMFKLLNLPGGSIMLGIGLSAEAVIFILSAFEPKEQEIDWSRVYPELAPDYNGKNLTSRSVQATPTITQKFDQCLEKASIDTALLENLAATMRRFSDNIASVPSFTQVGAVTEDYVRHIGQATQIIGDMAHTLTSMNGLYKKALAHMEDQTTHTHTLHSHLETTVKAMEVAGNEAIHFKKELALLNEKVTALNEIYAKTLTAFKG